MPKHKDKNQLRHMTVEDSRLLELESEAQYLRTVIETQANLIAELQCRADPYSQDGEPLCNSFSQK